MKLSRTIPTIMAVILASQSVVFAKSYLSKETQQSIATQLEQEQIMTAFQSLTRAEQDQYLEDAQKFANSISLAVDETKAQIEIANNGRTRGVLISGTSAALLIGASKAFGYHDQKSLNATELLKKMKASGAVDEAALKKISKLSNRHFIMSNAGLVFTSIFTVTLLIPGLGQTIYETENTDQLGRDLQRIEKQLKKETQMLKWLRDYRQTEVE